MKHLARCSCTSILRATLSHGYPWVHYLLAIIKAMFKFQIRHGDIAFESSVQIKVKPKSKMVGYFCSDFTRQSLWYIFPHYTKLCQRVYFSIRSISHARSSLSTRDLLFWIAMYNLICASVRE